LLAFIKDHSTLLDRKVGAPKSVVLNGRHLSRYETGEDEMINSQKLMGMNVALAAFGFAAITGIASTGFAALIGAGGAAVPTPIPSLPAGDTLIATQTNPFAGLNAASPPVVVFTGLLTSSVYADPGTGGLDFLYQVSNDTTSADSLEELSLSSFAPPTTTTDVDFVIGSGNVDPNLATRSSGSGKTVDFFFPGIAQGANSDFLLIGTNSTTYMVGTGSVIDGGTGGTFISAPGVTMFMSNVPEPASFSAIMIAGGMLLGRRRR
jgi:hypothetical protein